MKKFKQGCVEYSIELVFPTQKCPVEYQAYKLWQQTVEFNTPTFKKICFSKRRSVTEEVNNDLDYKSLVKRYITKKNKAIYAKEYIGFNFWYPEKQTFTAFERSDIPVINFLEDKKEILGYTCQKAKVETAYRTLDLWFTKEIQLIDETGAIIHIDEIDGTVMEWEEKPVAKDIYFYLKYTVVSVSDEISDPCIFDVPADYIKFSHSDAVKSFAFKSLKYEAVKYVNPDLVSTVQGTWLYRWDSSNISLEIKKDKKNGLIIIRKAWLDHEEDKTLAIVKPGFISGERLVVGNKSGFYLLNFMNENHRWRLIENEFLIFMKMS
jgi:hypothetical protein